MLITGSSAEELVDFRTMLTSLEGKHESVEDAPAKRCRKLHDCEKGKDTLATIDKLLKKLTKVLKAGQSDQIKRAQQEQLDVLLIDMEVTDIEPIKLCQKIKDAYQRFQTQSKTHVKPPRILALVGSDANILPNIMIQMGQAGIETSIMKPLSEKDLNEILQFS